MDSGDFEALTCTLLDKQPSVTRADLYGTPRQKQYGIDAFAETPSGLIVASCKCYGVVKKGETAKWSDDFLDHYEGYWRSQNVRRFILAVAAPMHSSQRLADIETERARFAALGLEYDVWAPRQLQELLRDHPGVVSQYLGPEWEPRLCGRVGGALQPSGTLVVGSADDLQAQIQALREALTGEVEQQIDAIAQDFDQGRLGEIADQLIRIREAATWPSLSDRAKARTLRLEASLLVNRGDLDGAERLSDEADTFQLQEEPRLRALIAMYREGPLPALEALGEPSSQAGRTLRIGLLLNAEETALAETELAALPPNDPETLRLQAQAHLIRGDAAGALPYIQEAELRAPRHAVVRRVSAIVSYALALSPLAPPAAMVFPQPISRNIVRQDDESQRRLLAAYQVFKELSAAEGGSAAESDRVWSIACICNVAGRSAEANEVCRTVLAETPTSALAIGWALARGLEFDRSVSFWAVRAKIEGGDDDLNLLRAFEWLAEEAEAADAEAWVSSLPTETRSADFAAEVAAVAERLAARRGGFEEAEPTVAALDQAHKSGDWSLVEAELTRLAAEHPPAPFFLAVADELAGAGRWIPLAAHQETILNFATADAFRVGAFVAFNNDDPARALAILRDHVSAFPGARLPFDLRRLEIRALARTGAAPAALRKAAALAGETGSVGDQLLQAEFRALIGDMGGAAPAVRAALNSGALAPNQALMWAERLASDDVELAKALWRAAVAGELTDELALGAINLAYRLGVSHEQPALMSSLQRLSVTRPDLVQITSLDDVREMLRQRMERAEALEEKLVTGAAPIHIILPALHGNLADIYYLESPTWSQRRPLLIRHGGRGTEPFVDEPVHTWRLNLDITAVLLADQLGLLVKLDQLAVPVRVSAAMPAALLALEEKSRPNQPDRIEAARAVAEALDAGRIRVEDERADVLHVAHEPEESGRAAIGLADVLAALRDASAIDPDTLAAAQSIMGAPPAAQSPLPRGSALNFEMGTLNLMAQAGTLGAALDVFEVRIEASTADQLRAEIEHATRGETIAEWLSRVRQFIRDRIESERYGLLPSAPRFKDEAGEEVDVNDPVLTTLLDVVRGADAPGEVVWIDDRQLSGHVRAGQALVVGAFDVLTCLRRDRVLSEQDYYAALRRLRAGGALFLPITPAEVLHHLRSAAIVDGVLVETPALAALRRNAALALLHEDHLKIFETEGPLAGRPNEMPFVLGLRRIAELVLVEIWPDAGDVAIARARSDWVWFALRAEHLRRTHGPVVDPKLFTALNIAGVAASVVHLTARGATASLRRAYMQWADDTLISPRLPGDPLLAAEIARLTAMLIQSSARPMLDEPREPGVQEAMRGLLRVTVALLPESLRDKVAADPGVRRTVRLDAKLAIHVRGASIEVERFWKAVAEALNYGRARLRDTKGRRIRLTRQQSAPIVIKMTGAVRSNISDPTVAVLSRDTAVRAAAIGAFLDEVDTPLALRKGVADKIEAAKTPAKRLSVLDEERVKSVMTFGRSLTEALGRNDHVSLQLFDPPAASSWLQYLRWPQAPVADAIEQAAHTLEAELGASIAFDRLAALPIRLPGWVYEDAGVSARSTPSAPERTPLVRFHRLHAAASDPNIDDHVLGEQVDALLRDYRGPGSIFALLLRWAERRFEVQPGWRDLGAAERAVVIWTYADTVTDILCSLPLDYELTVKTLLEHLPSMRLIDDLALTRGLDDSALSPTAIYDQTLLMAGLEFALAKRFEALEQTSERLELFAGYFGAKLDDGQVISRPMRSLEDVVNPLPTWLSRPPADRGPFGSTLDGDAFLAQAVQALGRDPTEMTSWHYLLAWGPPGLPAEAERALGEVISALDVDPFVATAGMQNMRMVADAAALLAGEAAGDALMEKLLAFADREMKFLAPADRARPGWLPHLLQAAANASKSYEPGRGVERLTRFAGRLLSIAPSVAATLRHVLDAAVDATPADEAIELWRALLIARSV